MTDKLKAKVRVTIEIEHTDGAGFDNSLDEAVALIKDGYYEGSDSNDDEAYYFNVETME